jgi:hypothetical protein
MAGGLEREPIFLTLDEVLEIHEQQIEWYGGSYGLRDPGALESACSTGNSSARNRTSACVRGYSTECSVSHSMS